jgi:hypothetical protein
MNGEEGTFSRNDEKFRGLLVADLSNKDGVVDVIEVCVHYVGVGWDKGKIGTQLIGADVLVGYRGLTCEDAEKRRLLRPRGRERKLQQR